MPAPCWRGPSLPTPPWHRRLPEHALIAITPDGAGVGEVLAERLRERGFDAQLTDQVSTDADGVI